jgi:cell division protein FtsW
MELWFACVYYSDSNFTGQFSTTALIHYDTHVSVYWKYPLKYIGAIVGSEFLSCFFFVLVCQLFPILDFSVGNNGKKESKFQHTDKTDEDDYQIEKLKLLLHLVKFMDWVPEKCSEEFYHQSSSDFIYAG